ncbi:MAG: NADH-quinone oxidoreductase subunit C [Calditrichia bacterium]
MIPYEEIKEQLARLFPETAFEEFRGMWSIKPAGKDLPNMMKYLKTDSRLQFIYLTDITAVDFLKQEREPRFDVVYHLHSLSNNQRLRIKMSVSEDEPSIPTVSGVWKAALWLEREVYDMFGIVFEDHPDLRRILMPDMFDGFPLRKDYPLRGRGERDVVLDLK